VARTDAQETPGGVRLAIDAGVAVITIDRPAVRNAIGFATVSELDEALAAIESSAAAAVLVIRGGGDRAFVSGGDLKELATVRTHEQAVEMASRIRTVLDRIASLPIPVIAALNGHALGGGAEVAVAADIRIAAADITIGFNQSTLGIMPAWGGAERLTQLVGRSRALLAMATGIRYDAPTAAQLGLIDVVVAREDFETEWLSVATKIASLAPGSSVAIKAVVAAAAPAVHPHTRDLATNAFAGLWAAPAHWEAVTAMEQQRQR
jgi:enoyl-CoA hydratase